MAAKETSHKKNSLDLLIQAGKLITDLVIVVRCVSSSLIMFISPLAGIASESEAKELCNFTEMSR